VGNDFRIIENDGNDNVGGRFNGLSQGEFFNSSNGVRLSIDYSGGFRNNDVVLEHENSGAMAPELAVTPRAVAEGDQVTLTGRLADPDARDRLTLVVDWGDGSPVERFHPGRGPFRIPHRYRDDSARLPGGTYRIHVTWFDDHGAGAARDVFATVRNLAPQVFAGGPVVLGPAGNLVRWGFFSDPGADVWTAAVDYGDGSGPQPLRLRGARRFVLQHGYQRPGVYQVTVTVRDDDGGGGRDTFAVVVWPGAGRGLIDAALGVARRRGRAVKGSGI
jgi:hypothetical protein